MKLVSNFKDYYDFLIGKYGIDSKVVYERITQVNTYDWKKKQHLWVKQGVAVPIEFETGKFVSVLIDFCGTTYLLSYYQGKMYVGDQILTLDSTEDGYDNFRLSSAKENLQYHMQPTGVNDELKCPVVLNEDIKNIRLTDYGFQKVVPPEDAYLKIVDFLTKEPIIKDTRTDIEKVVSHGFDKRTSFRKM